MKIVSMTLENFRAYQHETKIDFSDLTTIIGKNDIGKSCLLEALEIFFNSELVKIEQSDANVFSESDTVNITVEFCDLPDLVVIDADHPTTLAQEYLLSKSGNLVIKKVYDCSKGKPTVETFVMAFHPTAAGVSNLLDLKEKELQQLVKSQALDVPLKGNPRMRHALWAACDDLQCDEVPILASKAKEDGKRIWEQIEAHLPMFALFQSDRQSRDSDGEVQNPLKGAISAAISEDQAEIENIQRLVQEKAEEIARLTHEALATIDPTLADTLAPKFVPPTTAKWVSLFSLGLDTDQRIPLNKRGSGVRRLILVSFFKAEAERRLKTTAKRNMIYAVEEPETSQHPSNQRVLIEALKDMSLSPQCQVILTTHSPGLAAELPTDSIRYISVAERNATPDISSGVDVYESVANALGLTPDSRVRVLICVEGPTDVPALKSLSKALHANDASIPNLEDDERFAFVVAGGSVLTHWVSENYLRKMKMPEVHIYDGDVATYATSVAEVNNREDGLGSWAVQTRKHEIECYLHADAIRTAYNFDVECVDHPSADKPSVPRAFALAFPQGPNAGAPMGDNNAKKRLTRAFSKMTAEMLVERDPEGEVEGWFRKMAELAEPRPS